MVNVRAKPQKHMSMIMSAITLLPALLSPEERIDCHMPLRHEFLQGPLLLPCVRRLTMDTWPLLRLTLAVFKISATFAC